MNSLVRDGVIVTSPNRGWGYKDRPCLFKPVSREPVKIPGTGPGTKYDLQSPRKEHSKKAGFSQITANKITHLVDFHDPDRFIFSLRFITHICISQ